MSVMRRTPALALSATIVWLHGPFMAAAQASGGAASARGAAAGPRWTPPPVQATVQVTGWIRASLAALLGAARAAAGPERSGKASGNLQAPGLPAGIDHELVASLYLGSQRALGVVAGPAMTLGARESPLGLTGAGARAPGLSGGSRLQGAGDRENQPRRDPAAGVRVPSTDAERAAATLLVLQDALRLAGVNREAVARMDAAEIHTLNSRLVAFIEGRVARVEMRVLAAPADGGLRDSVAATGVRWSSGDGAVQGRSQAGRRSAAPVAADRIASPVPSPQPMAESRREEPGRDALLDRLRGLPSGAVRSMREAWRKARALLALATEIYAMFLLDPPERRIRRPIPGAPDAPRPEIPASLGASPGGSLGPSLPLPAGPSGPVPTVG